MTTPVAYRERLAHLRLEKTVRQMLGRAALNFDAIEAQARQYKGSARQVFVTNANLRDLMAALATLDAMRQETP